MQISYGTPCTEESLRLEQTTLKVIFLWSSQSSGPWRSSYGGSGSGRRIREEKNRQDEGSVFGDRKHLCASGSTWLKYIVQCAKFFEIAQR